MSSHEISARDPKHKVIVGWDHPLQTFFMQVIDRAEEAAGSDDKIIEWLGCTPREMYEVDHLSRCLAPYADLSPQMGSTLYGDKDEGR